MRKYVMNISVLSAIAGAFSLIRTSKSAPRDWRLVLLWVGWLVTVANAVAMVSEKSDQKKLKA
ncbi:hypothetical protein [Mycetocola zhujimingii]|uniref:Uncharacterized protein n=1 Tax=Mycetocola zhujimingii TaxID=2079792 RepID=A0A2U1THJ7_9MICO|nr:hypothetical protein [Mycetocola zhujimingii]AWB86814.1 hypothetical protein C3E77_09405 [Mycetocola zhujimingii]PWC08362.1 hypothetical protein DF223_03225 [Mycetocola zhujimingii]